MAWQVKGWLDGGGVHDAWYRLLTRVDAGVMPVVMAPRVRELQVGSEEELGLRRLAGGLVDGVGVRVNKTRRAQLTAAVEVAVEAGLALQAEGQRMTAVVVKEAKALREAVRRMRPMWRAWRQGVLAGGPARWRATLEVREAADAVRSLQASRGSGGMCGLGSLEGGLHACELARAAEARVARELRELWRVAHRMPFLAMDDAVTAWRVAAALWRWRRWRTERAAALPAEAAEAVRRAASRLQGEECVLNFV